MIHISTQTQIDRLAELRDPDHAPLTPEEEKEAVALEAGQTPAEKEAAASASSVEEAGEEEVKP